MDDKGNCVENIICDDEPISLPILKYPGNCFYDDDNSDGIVIRDLPFRQDDIQPNVSDFVLFCRQKCGNLGYKFAGLQHYRQCFCGDEFGSYGKAPDADCNRLCEDGVNMCGGGWRNNIYHAIN